MDKYTQAKIAKGICLLCKEPALSGKKTCGRHNEALNIRRQNLLRQGLCRTCGKPPYIKYDGKPSVWCKDCYIAKQKRLGALSNRFNHLPCSICGWDICCDTHHKNGNHKNNNPDNLVILCPNHHKMVELGLLSL